MAVVIYRALTGQPAFPGDSTPQIMFDIVYKMPKRPSAAVKGVPNEIDLVLAIGLAKSPEDRFQSASELSHWFTMACRREIPSELRARAQRLLRVCAWGATMTARSETGEEPAGS
jgi:serine/threonine-protein kinase